MRPADTWKDYELLDATDGNRLERWGETLLVRPDPQVVWKTPQQSPLWAKADAVYHRSNQGGGEWEYRRRLPEKWKISCGEGEDKLTLIVSPTGFKHTGVFPEQAVNWAWYAKKIRAAGRPIKVLNLFGYTGGATLACAAAAAGGRVELAGCTPGLYAPLLEILEQMGCTVERARDAAAISRFGALRGAGNVHTAPYPGLATDAAPLLAAVMLCAQDESSLQDRVFEHRFACADGFAALGANVRVAERTLYVQPGGTLHGARLTAPDLRGGAALCVAALAAEGETRVSQICHIDRGDEDLARDLQTLGADVRRVEETEINS